MAEEQSASSCGIEHARPVGYEGAFGRSLITFLFGIFTLPLILDYLWPLWDDRNQTLHDKVPSTVVVRV